MKVPNEKTALIVSTERAKEEIEAFGYTTEYIGSGLNIDWEGVQ